uniref:Uncharacterized protein n=1 Tax=Onchocerca volvulus TaxID=6282 RepID=A0A8R1XRV7_ONCVO
MRCCVSGCGGADAGVRRKGDYAVRELLLLGDVEGGGNSREGGGSDWDCEMGTPPGGLYTTTTTAWLSPIPSRTSISTILVDRQWAAFLMPLLRFVDERENVNE